MKTVICFVLGFALSGLFAQQRDVALPVPEGTPVRKIHVEVGPDGIGRVVSAPEAVIQQVPQLPLYNSMKNSGFFSTAGPTRADAIPIPAPARVTELTFWYFDNVGGPNDTVDVDLVFYDGTGGVPGSNDDRAEIVEGGCRAFGLPIQAITINDVPQDRAYSWIVSVNLGASSFVAPGRIWIEHRYYGQTGGTGGSTGPVLSAGDVVGVPLGVHSTFPFANYAFGSSGSDSQNRWYNPATAGCLWFNPWPLANAAYELRGRYGLVCELGGEYGSVGPALLAPTNKIWIAVVDPADPARPVFYDVVTVYGDDGQGGINRWFMLPFGRTGPFEVTVLSFNGFLGVKRTVTADLTGFGAHVVFPLTRGDATGDNTINLMDLNSVLANFGKSGHNP